MTQLIEAIKKSAIETGECRHLFCQSLAKCLFVEQVAELAYKVGEDLTHNLRTDQPFYDFKFKNSFAADPMSNDAEEFAAHVKRAQIDLRSGAFGRFGAIDRSRGAERPYSLQDFPPEDGFHRCPQNQSQRYFKELFGVLTGGDNMQVAVVQQQKEAMTLNASGNANRFVFTVLLAPLTEGYIVSADCEVSSHP